MATKPEPFVSLGWSAISWIEHYLVHGPGDVQGQPVELDDEFAQFILKAYRLNPETGARRVRRAFLSRAKGRSKSGLAAFLACFEALGPARFDHWAEPGEVSDWGYEYEPGEPVGKPLVYVEALCVATEEGQAGNTYDGIHYMLNSETCSEALLDDYPGLDVGLSRVVLPGSRGSIEPLSSGDSSKDGGKSTFIVADETHLWTLPRLKSMHATMARNLLKRKVASGWMLETSTMYGAGEDSVAEGTHAYAKSAKPGTRAAESLLFDHKQASDKWNLKVRNERIAALHESYGPASAWMDIESLADAWDDPQVTEAEYRRYWLNQPVPMKAVETVFGKGYWEAGEREARPVDLELGALAVAVSIDGSKSTIAASGIDGDEVWVKPLQYGPGTSWVVEAVAEFQYKHQVDVVIDGRGPGAMLIPALEREGVRLRVAGTGDVLDACAQFEALVNDGLLLYEPAPELTEAVAAAVKRDVQDRWAWGRRKASGDISPLEAATLAAWAAQSPLVSAYESGRGVLTV